GTAPPPRVRGHRRRRGRPAAPRANRSADHRAGAEPARWRHGFRRTLVPGCPVALPRHERGDRQPPRRQRQHRHPGGGPRRAGRQHPAHAVQRLPRRQPGDDARARMGSGARPRAGRHGDGGAARRLRLARVARVHLGGVHRLREGPAGAAQLRVVGQRLGPAHRRGAVQPRHRHADDARALPGRRAGLAGRGRGAGGDVHHHAVLGHRIGAGREAEGARHRQRRAHLGLARGADRGGGRAARLRGGRLVRLLRARGDAARDRRPDQRGVARSHGATRPTPPRRGRRRDPATADSGGDGRGGAARDRDAGPHHPRERHHARI
ncbi:MAG: BUG/TctC family periplasmic protein, partial [uncultured Acetobacteraceae bacterium]